MNDCNMKIGHAKKLLRSLSNDVLTLQPRVEFSNAVGADSNLESKGSAASSSAECPRAKPEADADASRKKHGSAPVGFDEGPSAKPAATRCYYTVLKVHRLATLQDIARAYRRLAIITHPDKGGSASDFHLVNNDRTLLGP